MTENTKPTRTPSAIDAAAEKYSLQLFDLNPELATMLGVSGYETEYHDHSPAGLASLNDLAVQTLAALDSLEATDDVDQVTLGAMRERIGLEIETYNSGWTLASLNNIASPAQEIRAIFDLMPTDTDEQWGHIAGRLANVPKAIDGYIESLAAAKEAGKVAAIRQVKTVVEQVTRYAEDGGFFDKLVAGASDDGDLRGKLHQGAEKAKAAYRDLVNFLNDELLPVAPEKDAVGRERYALASRDFLGATVDLEDTYRWGVEELARIIAEQKAVAELIKPGASIEEAKQVLNNDPARQLHGTYALQSWMQGLSDTAVKELAGVHFDIPDIMKKLECMIAPTQDGGVYYTPPTDDFSRPGRMWWSVPEGEDSFTTWGEVSTVYHEGVPGHHLQCATAAYQSGLLNTWRRNMCWVSGHGEGWALYAERLMDELGYLSDPGDKMGMLDGQRMRAARVVFDIGLHLELEVPEQWGSGVWTAESGLEFLRKNLDMSDGQLNFEYLRYLGWPGQAPSYKVGQRIWEEIRAERENREGEAFDVKSFHTEALNLGGLPLDVLKTALLG
ncbi:hypothetical cytosolic protein [Renibacterium salmoninarum ATCC 33209]|uniref:Hypothetical cytosolic protein n=1 Tax=Renibacterium salmoninarum (strain ATCC 33209 / DSM 20767 / JCM 11484 / NBRC 15589 / NCIMB 2235) TaxID=288705 RepID=A9WU04_RENSM|nr:DUF885 domain-containing protein [Renibacterium salmoninarum]ABY24675.1 hypothetical cytosolic protein [Renibacterium salmoninarum ATCC 33209]